jgi:hypothetical protein
MAFPTTGVLDNFNDTESSPMTGWTEFIGHLASNGTKCYGVDLNSGNIAYWSGTTFGADTEAYVTISTLPDDGGQVSLLGRITIAGVTAYQILWRKDSVTPSASLFIITGGVGTQLGSDVAQTFSAGDVLGFSIIGTVLTGYKNGTSFITYDTVSDAIKYSAAGYIALQHIDITSSVGRLDDFGGGTVVSTTTVPVVAQSLSSSLPTNRVPLIRPIVAARTIASSLASGRFPKITPVISPRLGALGIATPLKKITTFPNAQNLTASNISVSIVIGQTVIATARTMTFNLISPIRTASGNTYPSPLSLSGSVVSPNPSVNKLVSALSLTEALINAIVSVTIDGVNATVNPNVLGLTLAQTGVKSQVTALINSLLASFNIPNSGVNNRTFTQANSITISLPSVDKNIDKIISSLSLALNAPVEKVAITIPISALSAALGLQAVTILGVSIGVTITPDAFILEFILPDSREMIVYKIRRYATKHDGIIRATDSPASRIVAKHDVDISVSK